MKDITKSIIQYHRKELRKLTWSLTNAKGTAIAILLMIVCFICSWLLNGLWISNVLISIGAGIVTGLVFYFLSNFRNNKVFQVQGAIEALTPFVEEFRNIANWSLMSKYPAFMRTSNLTISDMAFNVLESIDNLVNYYN